MTHTIEARPWYTRYIIARYDLYGRAWYVAGYHNGEYTWTRDYLYAREYSKRTAQQHVVRLIDVDKKSAYYTTAIVHF